MRRILALTLILMLLATSFVFADEPASVTVKAGTISAGFGEEGAKTVIHIQNPAADDLEIKSITCSNEADFSADLKSGFTVPKNGGYLYEVFLKDGKEPGSYQTTFTFTDQNNKTHTAEVKATVLEEFKIKGA